MNPINIIEQSPKLSNLLNKSSRNRIITESLGLLILKEDTEDFIKSLNINDYDKLSKRQKSLISLGLKDSNLAKHVINYYNVETKDNLQFKDNTDLFRDFCIFGNLMKAKPYADDIRLQKKVFKKIIDWNILGKKENLKLLRKGFNFHLDKNTLNDFVSDDSVRESNGLTFIKGLDEADKTTNLKCTILDSFAGISTIFGLSQAINADVLTDVMTKWTPVLQNTIGANPITIAALTTVGVGVAFYLLFKTMRKAEEQIVVQTRSDLIRFCDPDKMNDASFKSLTGERILGRIILMNSFDINNKKNKEYLILSSYLNEKLNSNNIIISEKMKIDLGLNSEQTKKLNNLSIDDIHELSLIQVPFIRHKIAVNKLSDEDKNAFKNISLLYEISDIKNESGNYFKEIIDIKNISKELLMEINKLSNNNKDLLNAYLNLYVDESGNCNKGLLNKINNSLKNNKSVGSIIDSEIEIAYLNKNKEEPNDEFLAYVKKIGLVVTGKDRFISVNDGVKKELSKIGTNYNFKHVDLINESHPVFFGKIKRYGDKVLSNIQKLRDNIVQNILIDNKRGIK